MNIKLFALISLVLVFLAGNSLLARAALVDNGIDAYSFTFFRLLFGALVLVILISYKNKSIPFELKKNWNSSIMLFVYAICFSLAYINIDAGIGALILFASVQLTLIAISIINKENMTFQKAFGVLVAFTGLFYLLMPTQNFQISIYHTILMIIAGIAWGFYTVLGKSSTNATYHTGDNFIKATLICTFFYFFFKEDINISTYGVILALISGGITSALGYALWYYLLPNMQISTSGIIQLLIPPIAIALGVIFLNEDLSVKLVLSTLIILLGIYIYFKSKKISN